MSNVVPFRRPEGPKPTPRAVQVATPSAVPARPAAAPAAAERWGRALPRLTGDEQEYVSQLLDALKACPQDEVGDLGEHIAADFSARDYLEMRRLFSLVGAPALETLSRDAWRVTFLALGTVGTAVLEHALGGSVSSTYWEQYPQEVRDWAQAVVQQPDQAHLHWPAVAKLHQSKYGQLPEHRLDPTLR